jgi:hypothetical protein
MLNNFVTDRTTANEDTTVATPHRFNRQKTTNVTNGMTNRTTNRGEDKSEEGMLSQMGQDFSVNEFDNQTQATPEQQKPTPSSEQQQ